METVAAVAAILAKIMQAAPIVLNGVEAAYPLAEKLISLIQGGDITPEQQAEVEAMVDDLFSQLQQPLPADDAPGA